MKNHVFLFALSALLFVSCGKHKEKPTEPVKQENKPVDSVYHFDGEKFVPKRNQPHRGLHQSLRDYKNLELFFRTKNHIVRIDQLNNGELRYASWNSPSTMSDKPDLVIVGGETGTEYDPELEVYTFVNGSYTYLCGVEEDTPTEKEGVMDHHEYLIVKRGYDVILKEERLFLH